MPRPTAGQLRHPILIEELTQQKDAQGGMLKTWTQYAFARAKVANMSGNERSATSQGGPTGEARTEFTIRYMPGVQTTMRVLYAGAYYNIIHVNDFQEEHRFLVLTCDTGLSDG